VRYLNAAKALGEVLVVGLNSDASVRRIKGEKRPLNSETDRGEVLAALACVDYIVVFEAPDPGALIQAVAPDVLVKGADWKSDQIVGADLVRRRGGEVIRIPLVEGVSTTGLIEKIRNMAAK
jgi:rfaE bifunctional protein nucleotidyltransferase chain/domain